MATASTPDLIKKIQEIPSLQNYRNSTKVMTIKGQPIMVEDIVTAALISRSNLLLLGDKRRGKTTLGHDVYDGIFGGVGIYIRADPKMDEKALFSHLNLGRYFKGEVKSDKELRELTDSINNNFIFVDELTRLPGLSQNRIYGLTDGYIDLDGKRIPIGNGYSVLFATGNEGAEYTGTFALDDALNDRFPVVLNVNDFVPQAKDDFPRLMKKHDPRVPDVEKKDLTLLIKDIYSGIKKLEATVMMAITAQYLVTALDDCPKRGKTKISLKKALPRACEGCGRLAAGCGNYFGLSPGAGEGIIGFTLALQKVAEAKYLLAKENKEDVELLETEVNDVLEVFKTFAGYTGMVNKQKVLQDFYGNPYFFLENITIAVQREFEEKKQALAELVGALKGGKEITDSMLTPFTAKISAGAAAALENPWRFIQGLVMG